MKHAPIVALALAAAFVAGCGGGSSTNTRNTDLEDELADLQKEISDLKGEIIDAEQRVDDESDRADGESDRADRAEGQLDDAEGALADAESRADDLEEEAMQTANQLRQANARRVLAGLSGFLGGTEIGNTDPDVTPRYRASALVNTDPGTADNPAVTFSSITPGMSGNWFRTSFEHRGATDSTTDRLDVYSDAEAPESAPFTSVYSAPGETIVARYHQQPDDPDTGINESDPGTVIDDNRVVGSVQISTVGVGTDRDDAAASLFPRSGAPRKDFDQTDRGEYTQAQRQVARQQYNDALTTARAANQAMDPASRQTDAEVIADVLSNLGTGVTDILDHTGQFRNQDRYPLRYTAEVSGNLGRASGTYTCASGTETDCRVTNQNNHFRFVGPWVFTPSSASAMVQIDDAEFMYFGWWAQQSNTDESWTFRTFHGPTETEATGNRSTAAELSQLNGTATYQGPAVGHYSFYQPEAGQLRGHSDYGEFTARATLTANFTAIGDGNDETVHGIIDQFDGHPDWTLTLKQRAIDGDGVIPPGTTGDASNAVSWQIEGEALAAPDSGTWEAAFYSDLSAAQRTSTTEEDAVPTGMAGTFEAAYHAAGAIIGAFGAHKQP